jgi:serine/threonine protein phosphatase PrpC
LDNLIINSKENIELKAPLLVQSLTDMGMVRTNNEDYFGHYIPSDPNVLEKLGSLFVISDGVGGSTGGEIASAESVNVLLQEYYFGNYSERGADRLKDASNYTARHIFDLASRSYKSTENMKCTLSALLIKQDKFFISHVGDSKIFLLRGNKISQLTKDHTLVGKLVRLGFVSQEEAKVHPNRHILLKSLGDQPLLSIDFYSGKVQRQDIFCLVTDGITEHLTVEEINSFLQKDISHDGLKEIVREINCRGGYDNMTIMTVKVNELV